MKDYKAVEKAMKKFETNGKTLFLAQDQGLEHGPYELIGETHDPDYIFEIAEKGEIDAFICQKGLAEKYAASYKVKLMVKVNGKANLGPKDDPYSPVICSVKRAVELGADAIGFTLFPGSKYMNKQLDDFRKVQEEAHDYGLPVACWMYPRGAAVKDASDDELLKYCARIGFEIGADFIKVRYNGNPENMKDQVKMAAKTKVVMSGGVKTNSSKEFLETVRDVNNAGAQGFAIGRNIWQHEDPLAMTKALRDVQIRGKDVYEALKRFTK